MLANKVTNEDSSLDNKFPDDRGQRKSAIKKENKFRFHRWFNSINMLKSASLMPNSKINQVKSSTQRTQSPVVNSIQPTIFPSSKVHPSTSKQQIILTPTTLSTKRLENKWKQNPILEARLKNVKKLIWFLLFVFVLIIVFAILVYASFRPCSFTLCHEKAALCLNKFPFKSQCICDSGYTGNGKTYCVECGKSIIRPATELRIIGGKEAIRSSWPFSAYITQSYKGRYKLNGLSYVVSYSWSCGGTIINPKTILTAAHCIHDHTFEYEDEDKKTHTLVIQWNEWYSDLESTFSVYVGVHDVRQLNIAKKMRVKKINKHEYFDELNFENDLATIQLFDAIEPSISTQYACLPNSFSILYPESEQNAYIIGWGRVSENGPSSNVLKNAKVRIYPSSSCASVEEDILKNWNAQICAGAMDGTTDTCQGDSGGGLFVKDNQNNTTDSYKYVIAGIVSYGIGCGRPNFPGVYTRTSYYFDWILEKSDY